MPLVIDHDDNARNSHPADSDKLIERQPETFESCAEPMPSPTIRQGTMEFGVFFNADLVEEGPHGAVRASFRYARRDVIEMRLETKNV